jgi:hypothetical protein
MWLMIETSGELSYEDDNGLSGCKKVGKFIHKLSYNQLLKTVLCDMELLTQF